MTKEEIKNLGNVAAINEFFTDPEDPKGTKPSIKEHKALSSEERQDLGNMCRTALLETATG